MTVLDLRGSWPCSWCDDERVLKRGAICTPCQLKLEHHRGDWRDTQQLPLEDPAAFGSVVAFRGIEDVPTGDVF